MSALLMFKIIVPFILLSAAFVSICKIQRLPSLALILLTLVLSERELHGVFGFTAGTFANLLRSQRYASSFSGG
jgi:hypothetical protein